MEDLQHTSPKRQRGTKPRSAPIPSLDVASSFHGGRHTSSTRQRGTNPRLTPIPSLTLRISVVLPEAAHLKTRNVATRRRSGVTMIEIIAAMGLFSVVVLLVAPAISGVAAVRDEAVQHQTAVLELSNLLEHIAARAPNDPLTQDALNQLAISDAAAGELIDPELTVTLGDPEGTPPMRPLTASLTWRNGAGQYGTPARFIRFLPVREGSP